MNYDSILQKKSQGFLGTNLKRYLRDDENDDKSNHDFGKNIIPGMLKDKRKLIAYPFKGYWKDVPSNSSQDFTNTGRIV